jgi:hypothetical protein
MKLLTKILLTCGITILILGPLISKPAFAQFEQPEPGFTKFWSMRFAIHFPNNWSIVENMPNEVKFLSPNSAAWVVVNWGYPAPNWILDKGAWLSNMTKHGIVVDKIDNTTTIANHTSLTMSFVENSMNNSVTLVKANNTVFDFVYFANINDFPTYEDKANIMLNSFRINSGLPTFQDSRCTDTLLSGESWYKGVYSNCPADEENK